MRASQRTNLATSGDRAGRGTADIDGDLALMVLRLVGSSLDAGCNIGPCTVVEWLLLTPNDFGVRVLVEMRSDLVALSVTPHATRGDRTYEVIRERRDLLET